MPLKKLCYDYLASTNPSVIETGVVPGDLTLTIEGTFIMVVYPNNWLESGSDVEYIDKLDLLAFTYGRLSELAAIVQASKEINDVKA